MESTKAVKKPASFESDYLFNPNNKLIKAGGMVVSSKIRTEAQYDF